MAEMRLPRQSLAEQQLQALEDLLRPVWLVDDVVQASRDDVAALLLEHRGGERRWRAATTHACSAPPCANLRAMLELRCTVRGCGVVIPAAAAARPVAGDCAGSVLRGSCGHCFDIARSGYLNLLQPQDRRAREAGDAAATVAARRRLFDAGAGTALLAALTSLLTELGLPPRARALDVGAGEGSLIGALAARLDLEAAGVDLSVRAVALAARRHPGVLWLVANADRGLPLADRSLDLVLSISARRNPAECSRVLAHDGRLVVAVPAPDDLAELRTAVLGSAAREQRLAKLLEEHAAHFELAGRRESRERKTFSAPQLEDLLVSTYRGGRAGRRERVKALGDLAVTLSHEIVVFVKKPPRVLRAHPVLADTEGIKMIPGTGDRAAAPPGASGAPLPSGRDS